MTVQILWMLDRLHLTDEFQSTARSKFILRTAARRLLLQYYPTNGEHHFNHDREANSD
jgi:hypothetical protein